MRKKNLPPATEEFRLFLPKGWRKNIKLLCSLYDWQMNEFICQAVEDKLVKYQNVFDKLREKK